MSNSNNDIENTLCLCGSNHHYVDCCLRFHDYQSYPETAEQLMRSRYSAYALHLKSYLLETWAISTRPGQLEFENGLSWKSLTIKGSKKGRLKDQQGWVTFTAVYQIGFDQVALQERSFFNRDVNRHWCYVDGQFKD